MTTVLALAESRGEGLADVSFEAITAARALADEADARLAVALVARRAEELARPLAVHGVDEVLIVEAATDQFEPHLVQRAVEQLVDAERPAAVVLGHTIDSLGFAPALAVSRGLGLATDVVAVGWEDGPVAWRRTHSDKLTAELDFPGKPGVVITVRPGAFAPTREAAEVASLQIALDSPAEQLARHVALRRPSTDSVDIAAEQLLLAVGRGVDDREQVPRLEQLAQRLGGTLSASRPLVDAGWVDSARQVGQSGKTVKPKVYLALGISGAVQHVAGMREAETIVAVNTDPAAPIFSVAHFGAVVDLLDVAHELEQLLD